MIQLKTYSNEYSHAGNDLHKQTEDFGESNTDKSFYRPDISSARASMGSSIGSNRTGLYDFDDGKDTGETIQTILRTKGLDPTEIHALEIRIEQNIQDKKEQDKESVAKKLREMTEKQLQDYIKNISENSSKSENKSE